MKVQRSTSNNTSDKGKQYHTKPSELCTTSTMKTERRKSGRFLGLSFKPLFSSDSSKHGSSSKESDESGEKSSLLKRLSFRRSSKKKRIKDESHKKPDEQSSDSKTDASIDAGSDGADNTPTVKITKKGRDKVYEALNRTPWGSDDSDGEENVNMKPRAMKKRRTSLNETGRKLKRSMSMLCGGSRSKAAHDMNLTDIIVSQKQKNKRRSLGGVILRPASRNKYKDNEASSDTDANSGKENASLLQLPSGYNLKNAGSTPKTTDLIKPHFIFPDTEDNQSPGGSTGKWKKPKRQSYDKMNQARDSNSIRTPNRKVKNSFEVSGSEPRGSPSKRKQSIKRGWSSFKHAVTGNTSIHCESFNTAQQGNLDGIRRSLRRKSLGTMSPSSERRRSGIYATANTPTFMTCGFVMTDSPPDDPDDNDSNVIAKPLVRKRKRSTRQDVSMQETMEASQIHPDYNSDDLPWVSMKRKRRSEIINKQQVNRFNAGHTPLPARKKRKSVDERLV